MSEIKDSGSRREFGTGAVRDIDANKGRCDLMPLEIIADIYGMDQFLFSMGHYIATGDVYYIESACQDLMQDLFDNEETALLELAQHFEAGAEKYGEYNWQKGIPAHCYVDSAVRHYLKACRGDEDEPHKRAALWNVVCLFWTVTNKPELDDIRHKENAGKDA